MAQGPTHSLARLGNELVNQAGEYARLMRLDRPVGTWLLLWPTLWGLWIAGAGRPEPVNFLVFVAGVFVMRSAGCVINDFADRDIDSEVERTQSRPLAAGRVTPAEALTLFAVLGLVALALLLLLNPLARLLAVADVRHRIASRLVEGCDEWWQVPAAVVVLVVVVALVGSYCVVVVSVVVGMPG